MSAPRARLGRLRIRLATGDGGTETARALGKRLERDLAGLSPDDWARLARTSRIEIASCDGTDGAAQAVSRALRGIRAERNK